MAKISNQPLDQATPAALPAGLVIRYRALSSLRPYGKNSRTHSARQIAKLEASLIRYGWTNPLLVAGDDLLAGHARLQAACNLAARGMAIARHLDPALAPTIDLSALSPAERRGYIIADNRLAEDAGWDNDLLRIELTDLQAADFDLPLTGFSAKELSTLLGEAGPPAAPQLTQGMQYQLVIDCTDEAHQARLLGELQSAGLSVRPLIL